MCDKGGESGVIAGKWTKQIHSSFKGINASKILNDKISLKYKNQFIFFPWGLAF